MRSNLAAAYRMESLPEPFIEHSPFDIPEAANDPQMDAVLGMPENNIPQKIAKSWMLNKSALILFLVLVIVVAVMSGWLLT